MIFKNKTIKLAVNPVFYNLPVIQANFNNFKDKIINFINSINFSETEEFNKNIIRDFIKDSFYNDYYVNTSDRIDLAIYSGKTQDFPLAVIFEVKKPLTTTEMVTESNFAKKAFYELVLYYLREKISNNNHSVQSLIITDAVEWFVFDSRDFERLFARNNALVNEYKNWVGGSYDTERTSHFYNEIAPKYINNEDPKDVIEYVHFSFNPYIPKKNDPTSQTLTIDDDTCFDLFKLLSPENLLKKPFANDSNSLNKEFYNELLYILGLEEQTSNGKKVITQAPKEKRLPGSIIENTIKMIEQSERFYSLQNLSQFGDTYQDQLFSIALELTITWLNRILFLKLLEGQLVNFHNGDYKFKFLTQDIINDYGQLQELFFEVLAVPVIDRDPSLHSKYEFIPYLNSSLFDQTYLEINLISINQLKNKLKIPVYQHTVLKDQSNSKISGEKDTLHYLFEFLDSFDFSNISKERFRENSKTIINAAVLGLIFEKINGYKDGSYFTPGFITMYMARESIRRTILQKFNNKYNWNCSDFDDLRNYLADRRNKKDFLEFNSLINSITICDPAVGSGHFLVSCLNELVACKSDLRLLCDQTGVYLPIKAQVVNDELVFTDNDGNLLKYNPKSYDSNAIQKAIFNEKVNLIENCLFGVDINPKSVYITRLRLWIELLKNAYYKTENELETLPNIDINIKAGNSLNSRFDIHSDKFRIKDLANIKEYKNLVNKYKNTTRKAEKKNILNQIENIKNNIQSFSFSKSEQEYKLNEYKQEYHEKFENKNRIQFELTEEQKKEQERQKKDLWAKIEKLEKEVEELKRINENKSNYFEWRFEFPEILDDDGNYLGFDVIIGNPPYIQLQKEGGKLGKLFEENKYETFARTGDIYALFYEKGIDLLKNNAYLIFITSNKWMRAGYGEKLRNFFTKHKPLILIDLGPGVFDSATVDTNILMIQKVEQASLLVNNESQSRMIDLPFYACTLKSDINDDTDIAAYFKANKISMPKPTSNAWFIGSDAEQRLKEKIERIGKPLKDWDVNIYRGVLTGLNEAFIITTEKRNEILANCQDEAERQRTEAIIKPILRGRDIKRYYYEWAGLWVIFIPWHFPLHEDLSIQGASEKAEIEFKKQLPSVYNHLLQFKDALSKRNKEETGIRYEWYALQRCAATYYQEFEKEKVVLKNIGKNLAFCITPKGMFNEASCFMLLHYKINYLLGFLNSKFMRYYIYKYADRTGAGDIAIKGIFIETFPIPPITSSNEPIVNQIEALVDKILAAKKQNPQAVTTAEEQEIDNLVYRLYDLTEEEIEIIEGGK